jgi:multisubunit Na+/H+ antiporter MnhC subunit
MALKVEYLNDNRGLIATASGELTGETFVEAVRQVNEFAIKTTPLCYAFFDFEELTAISITVGHLAQAAMCALEAAKHTETERIVAIHASEEYTHQLAVIYMMFIEETGWEAWTFRDRGEAASWLRGRAALKHGIIIDAI